MGLDGCGCDLSDDCQSATERKDELDVFSLFSYDFKREAVSQKERLRDDRPMGPPVRHPRQSHFRFDGLPDPSVWAVAKPV